ncbi:tRNA pseudouridine(13) synthase TruD [Thioalkalivibrio denitrificans]|uniref:tRNA pseudouridine synthase D n=1 Tax=Thioalkalivibrio denitrificans TaxID=108003 RepID=A0A1V3N725_9GAMM|nr:tRNA pseudouridine(13) synthase TruD [Thioalkalivibrio denitrificans]OOG20622.1 tRNA pseudouridine(13) synthase TruD [Thioalkalivibrio denitrificans]
MNPSNPPLFKARIRSRPEDFVVEEIQATEPDGQGEHVWILLEKTGCNSEHAARCLARAAGVSNAAVGYAGRKDRHAVTTQWFSVHLPGQDAPDWSATLGDEFRVLRAERHSRKLKTGHLAGNRFRLTLRECNGDLAALEERLALIRERGVPNYFGPQRFGRNGANLDKARAMFEGTLRVRDRRLRGIYLSAARSALFNRVLESRVAQGTWCRALPGDVMILDGSRSHFPVEQVDALLEERVRRFDIHPSGPLWGQGSTLARGDVAMLEQSAADEAPELARGLAQAGLKQERRALRMRVEALSARWPDRLTLVLAFQLPPGGYATTVLSEIAAIDDAADTEPEA